MSVLIEIRKRIKAIETIKKITHAMQLISMSTHAKLRTREQFSYTYQQQLGVLYQKIKAHAPHWSNKLFFPIHTETEKHLIIILGSQKGLVGNFNTTTASLFTKHFFTTTTPADTDIILVGRKIIEHLAQELKEKKVSIINEYPEFSLKNFSHLSDTIINTICTRENPYSSVTVYSNQQKTFFVQKATVTKLIPFAEQSTAIKPSFIDYDWQQQPAELLDSIAHQYMQAHFEYLLFESLLAEHAARFLSMDNATRNAKDLLDETTLQYNKLRQFKITKELTEIASGFLD